METRDGLFIGRMLIGGEFVESAGGGWIETINPANEEPIGRVPEGTAVDVERAAAAPPVVDPEGRVAGRLNLRDRSDQLIPSTFIRR